MNKPISNLTFVIISVLFLILGSGFLYIEYEKLELIKEEIKHIKKEIYKESNESNFFNSFYIKTKDLFN